MKVVCDACQAKYQIPDERVAGRKLKIRCRKCGNAIVVRGEHASGEVQTISSIPPAAEVPRGIEWHVSIEGEQHGPYPSDQMGSMLRAGQLAWDAFVWRDGYADWRPAGESDTLVHAVAATADDEPTATAPNPAATYFESDEDPTRMAQSPTGENLQPVARVAFATRARATSQPPMTAAAVGYGGHASQPPMSGAYAAAHALSQPVAAASYAPRAVSQPPVTGYAGPRAVSQVPSYDGTAPALRGGASIPQAAPAYAQPRSEPLMTGERNEDSVLFSARNLALAASPGVSTAPPQSTQSGGYASGEGSGLIDIRALAALSQTQQSVPSIARPRMPAIERNVRNSDAVLRMANQTGAFAHLDSLAPIDRSSQPPSRAVPLAILGGSAMIAAAAFLAMYIFRPQPLQQTAATAVPNVGVAEPALSAAPVVAPEPVAAAPEPVEVAKAAPEPADEPVAPAPSARSSKSGKTVSAKRAAAVEHTTHAAKSEPTRAASAAKEAKPSKEASQPSKEKSPSIDDMLLGDSGKKPEPKAAPTPDDDLLAGPAPAPAKKEPAKNRSIDDLLDDAVPAKGAKPAASEAANAALPETPTRDQVLAAMHSVEPDVKACAEGQGADVTSAQVAVTVTGATGHVTSVRVTGIQGNVGSCIARAVRAATFPKFAKASLSINFPFKLK